MAYVYIGIDPSKGKADITISGSTTSKALEVCVDTAKLVGKSQVRALLDHIEGRLAVESWPPA